MANQWKNHTELYTSAKMVLFFRFQGIQNSSAPNLKPNESCWRCPENLGDGRFHKIELRPGFEIWISDCIFHRETEFSHRNIPPVLQFSFSLSGHYRIYHDNPRIISEYTGKHQGIHYFHNSNTVCRVMAKVPVQCVSVLVYPSFFFSYLKNEISSLPPCLATILESANQNGFSYNKDMSPHMHDIIRQISECRQKGLKRKIFLESRALELLFLQLEQLSDNCSYNQRAGRLHPQDRKQTERARNYLVSNLETPPCLCDLARAAGMSHPKLNRCFKQIYGMTVFQYLRYERLNKAREMLENDGFSVTETAYQVGYDSLSHFSQAYKKQFGTSPSNCLKVA